MIRMMGSIPEYDSRRSKNSGSLNSIGLFAAINSTHFTKNLNWGKDKRMSKPESYFPQYLNKTMPEATIAIDIAIKVTTKLICSCFDGLGVFAGIPI